MTRLWPDESLSHLDIITTIRPGNTQFRGESEISTFQVYIRISEINNYNDGKVLLKYLDLSLYSSRRQNFQAISSSQ